jgi:hypothetical protein
MINFIETTKSEWKKIDINGRIAIWITFGLLIDGLLGFWITKILLGIVGCIIFLLVNIGIPLAFASTAHDILGTKAKKVKKSKK